MPSGNNPLETTHTAAEGGVGEQPLDYAGVDLGQELVLEVCGHAT